MKLADSPGSKLQKIDYYLKRINESKMQEQLKSGMNYNSQNVKDVMLRLGLENGDITFKKPHELYDDRLDEELNEFKHKRHQNKVARNLFQIRQELETPLVYEHQQMAVSQRVVFKKQKSVALTRIKQFLESQNKSQKVQIKLVEQDNLVQQRLKELQEERKLVIEREREHQNKVKEQHNQILQKQRKPFKMPKTDFQLSSYRESKSSTPVYQEMVKRKMLMEIEQDQNLEEIRLEGIDKIGKANGRRSELMEQRRCLVTNSQLRRSQIINDKKSIEEQELIKTYQEILIKQQKLKEGEQRAREILLEKLEVMKEKSAVRNERTQRTENYKSELQFQKIQQRAEQRRSSQLQEKVSKLEMKRILLDEIHQDSLLQLERSRQNSRIESIHKAMNQSAYKSNQCMQTSQNIFNYTAVELLQELKLRQDPLNHESQKLVHEILGTDVFDSYFKPKKPKQQK